MYTSLSHYELTNLALWQGRKDTPLDRYFQRVECIDIHTHALTDDQKPIIIGFCSDEGIRRNEGRLGARQGPHAIREQLAKLACTDDHYFLDAGNIVCDAEDLEAAQQQLAKLVAYCHSKQHRTILLGGGHETAWGHYLGLTQQYPSLGIINFDAHFDIRSPLHEHQGTSGTPFAQIKTFCQEQNLLFDYCCIGVQQTANTKHLFDRAHAWGISYMLAEDIYEKSLAEKLFFIDQFVQKHTHIYLSVCLDVLAESVAPGVSAPQALGLQPHLLIPLLQHIIKTGKVVSFDMVELSPPWDEKHQTARLAANILAQMLKVVA